MLGVKEAQSYEQIGHTFLVSSNDLSDNSAKQYFYKNEIFDIISIACSKQTTLSDRKNEIFQKCQKFCSTKTLFFLFLILFHYFTQARLSTRLEGSDITDVGLRIPHISRKRPDNCRMLWD